MKAPNLYISISIFARCFVHAFCNEEKIATLSLQYTLTTKLLHSISTSDPLTKTDLKLLLKGGRLAVAEHSNDPEIV